MHTATRAAVRTTQAAATSLQSALGVSFGSGVVMGMSVVGLGLMGVAGAMAIQFVLPALGRIFDEEKIRLAGSASALDAMPVVEQNAILAQAAQTSFETNAILPALLIVVFGLIWGFDRSRGGYRPETLDG